MGSKGIGGGKSRTIAGCRQGWRATIGIRTDDAAWLIGGTRDILRLDVFFFSDQAVGRGRLSPASTPRLQQNYERST
jgi:hypothetical protein